MQKSIEWQSPLGDREAYCVYTVNASVCVLLAEEGQRLIKSR